jgi:tripartite-type tricarboxylate transporter receptor subunit TctC
MTIHSARSRRSFSHRSLRWLAACALAAAGVASAQPYPAKPIRIVAPFPPGGSVDVIARLVSPKLSELMGQQVVIDNRSGASGNIGTEMAMRAAPDGYTLLVHTLPFVTNQYLYPKVPYDAVKDFSPISLLAAAPALLVVHPSVPAKSVTELLRLARSKPGALNYASAGVGTNHHIAGELLNYLAKINVTAVQYKGGGPATIAALGGEAGITYPNVVAAVPYIKANRLRALAITSAQRSPVVPDIPTIAESGVPGYEFTPWFVMMAPAGTPPAVVTAANDYVVKAMRAPEVADRMARDGVDIIASTPDQLAKHIRSEQDKWSRVIKERGMRAE